MTGTHGWSEQPEFNESPSTSPSTTQKDWTQRVTKPSPRFEAIKQAVHNVLLDKLGIDTTQIPSPDNGACSLDDYLLIVSQAKVYAALLSGEDRGDAQPGSVSGAQKLNLAKNIAIKLAFHAAADENAAFRISTDDGKQFLDIMPARVHGDKAFAIIDALDQALAAAFKATGYDSVNAVVAS